jgi:Protein phosphatase 2C
VWRPIAQSLQGPSHRADGSPCQDSNCIKVLGSGEGGAEGETLVACVADGAGSAQFSDAGSLIACTTIAESATAYFHEHSSFDDLEKAEVVRWCVTARRRIADEAAARGCNLRELATTLSGAIVSPTRSAFFQIGDGVIVLGNRGLYGVVFWPQSGEYANSTNFLTSDEFAEQLEFLAIETRWSDVALLTDGLERLALRFDWQTPHPPFFDPLFRALRTTNDIGRLSEDLRRFLDTDSIQLRSDDDKTIIIASRTTDHLGDVV